MVTDIILKFVEAPGKGSPQCRSASEGVVGRKGNAHPAKMPGEMSPVVASTS